MKFEIMAKQEIFLTGTEVKECMRLAREKWRIDEAGSVHVGDILMEAEKLGYIDLPPVYKTTGTQSLREIESPRTPTTEESAIIRDIMGEWGDKE